MSEGEEPLLSRWSRLKAQARAVQANAAQANAAQANAAQANAAQANAVQADAVQARGAQANAAQLRAAPAGNEPAAAERPERAPPAAAGLPPVEALTPESDFRRFMQPEVDQGMRRAALKKLFADARFNVPDPFEAYSEDYTVAETIPVDMLKTLHHARKLLFDDTAQRPPERAEAPPEPRQETDEDVAGRQDA